MNRWTSYHTLRNTSQLGWSAVFAALAACSSAEGGLLFNPTGVAGSGGNAAASGGNAANSGGVRASGGAMQASGGTTNSDSGAAPSLGGALGNGKIGGSPASTGGLGQGSGGLGQGSGGAQSGGAGGLAMGSGAAATGGELGQGSGGVATGGSGTGSGGSPMCQPGPDRCDGRDDNCASGITDEQCPEDCLGVSDGTRGYMFCELPVNRDLARQKCEASGLHLTSILSAEENSWVRSTADSRNIEGLWLGGGDIATEGKWLWEDKVQFWQGNQTGMAINALYENWASAQPKGDVESKDCARMLNGSGSWDAIGCGAVISGFVCKLD